MGFSKYIGSSLSLLPSIMHRLENLLVAIELKHSLCSSFPEASEVSAERVRPCHMFILCELIFLLNYVFRKKHVFSFILSFQCRYGKSSIDSCEIYQVLEALTTEKCQERLSLERLEVLGDSFLKFAIARHLFLMNDSFHEGDLTSRRSNVVNNSNLFKLATQHNLQVKHYHDMSFSLQYFLGVVASRTRLIFHPKGVDAYYKSNVTFGWVQFFWPVSFNEWFFQKNVSCEYLKGLEISFE